MNNAPSAKSHSSAGKPAHRECAMSWKEFPGTRLVSSDGCRDEPRKNYLKVNNTGVHCFRNGIHDMKFKIA